MGIYADSLGFGLLEIRTWLDDPASLCSEGSGAKYRKYSGVSLTGNFELCISVNVGASGCLSLCRPATDW